MGTSDKTGMGVADVLKGNTSLQSLTLKFAVEMGDETGKAVADALKGNTSLQSLTLLNLCMGDETGNAFACALKDNISLRSLTVDSQLMNGDLTAMEIIDSLQDVCQRNLELPGHWLAVACFAHHAVSHKAFVMAERYFRRAVFAFFLPHGAARRMAAMAAARQVVDGPSMGRATAEAFEYQAEVVQRWSRQYRRI